MNTRAMRSTPSYRECYSAQVGALGLSGQRRLQRASVLIVGAGGLGTAVCTVLATTGVGRLIIVDPQRVTADNFNRYPSARSSDIGKPKVDLVAGFFEGRPHLTVVPIVGRAEALELMKIVHDVDLVVATSNTVASRIAVARFAARRGVPQVSAALTDGRQGFGGLITAWAPDGHVLACPACFLTPHAYLARGESLVAPVVSTVGALAALLTMRLLVDPRGLDAGNCLIIDLERHTLESLRVLRRSDCPVCSAAGRRRRVRERR